MLGAEDGNGTEVAGLIDLVVRGYKVSVQSPGLDVRSEKLIKNQIDS